MVVGCYRKRGVHTDASSSISHVRFKYPSVTKLLPYNTHMYYKEEIDDESANLCDVSQKFSMLSQISHSSPSNLRVFHISYEPLCGQ